MINKKFWYNAVSESGDLDSVADAIDYYRAIHTEGSKHTKMKGVLHRLLEEQPQMMQDYEDALTDCEMVHKWLEEEIKYLKAKKRIAFMNDPQFIKMKKTDIENFVVQDETIRLHNSLMMTIQLWRGSLTTLVARLNRRGMYLMMISKLRINGEHEVYIDTTHETDIEKL